MSNTLKLCPTRFSGAFRNTGASSRALTCLQQYDQRKAYFREVLLILFNLDEQCSLAPDTVLTCTWYSAHLHLTECSLAPDRVLTCTWHSSHLHLTECSLAPDTVLVCTWQSTHLQLTECAPTPKVLKMNSTPVAPLTYLTFIVQLEQINFEMYNRDYCYSSKIFIGSSVDFYYFPKALCIKKF